jgi:hypothetical protein
MASATAAASITSISTSPTRCMYCQLSWDGQDALPDPFLGLLLGAF